MSLYKNVLCGLNIEDDNSTDSMMEIVSVALALAGQNRNQLHIAHVCDPPVTGYGEGIGHHHPMTEARVRQNIYPRLKQILDSHQLPARQGHIIFGSTTAAMHQLARDLGCDLIVIGHHQRSILSRLLGSTTHNILQEAPCDILTVSVIG